jgi:hypothetical protein
MVEQANEILEGMAEQGYTLTLRQLFYQFVRRNWIANSEKSYKRLGEVVAKARLGGHISWDAIEDRNRSLMDWAFDEDPASVIAGARSQLVYDLWARQGTYCEVWVEKDAMSGVVARPCERLMVPYMACKGYLSLSESWRAGLRFSAAVRRGQEAVLFYLGDHDPSGIDMTRNHRERQDLFAGLDEVRVERLALNIDQVRAYDPPPNPTKAQDSRSAGYIRQFGETCWELDALEPSQIEGLIAEAVDGVRDTRKWNKVLREQEGRRDLLEGVSRNWGVIERYVRRKEGLS